MRQPLLINNVYNNYNEIYSNNNHNKNYENLAIEMPVF